MKAYLFLAGLVLGAGFTDYYHKAEIAKRELKQAHANAEYNNAITELSNEYYKLYQAELNREPATITKRVFVKASCPELPADTAGSVGAGGDNETRAELHAETVARITAVTNQAEQEVILCRIALKSVIEKIQK